MKTKQRILENSSIPTEFIIEENAQIPFEDIKSKIEANDISAAIIITKNENTINLEYVVENIGMISSIPESYINNLSIVIY